VARLKRCGGENPPTRDSLTTFGDKEYQQNTYVASRHHKCGTKGCLEVEEGATRRVTSKEGDPWGKNEKELEATSEGEVRPPRQSLLGNRWKEMTLSVPLNYYLLNYERFNSNR